MTQWQTLAVVRVDPYRQLVAVDCGDAVRFYWRQREARWMSWPAAVGSA